MSKTVMINDYTLMSFTGSVSDAQRMLKIVPAELKLKELRARSRPTVSQVANLVSGILYSGARQSGMIVGTLIGGFNPDGSTELYSIEPAGSALKIEDYDANFSSGMPFVLGLLERQYKKGMGVKEGVELAKEAIKSSTEMDVGSGYGIDVFTITKEGIKKVVDQVIEPNFKDKQ
jgi:20S proteasome alpha/beta subunit